MFKRCLASLLVGVAVLSAVAANGSWEEMRKDNGVASAERVETEQIEVFTRDGYVYITTSQPVTVKIFSILGQLISQEDIQAGSYRLRMVSRGIYILKAGTVTRRITI